MLVIGVQEREHPTLSRKGREKQFRRNSRSTLPCHEYETVRGASFEHRKPRRVRQHPVIDPTLSDQPFLGRGKPEGAHEMP
jgi:hypothetical protein